MIKWSLQEKRGMVPLALLGNGTIFHGSSGSFLHEDFLKAVYGQDGDDFKQ